MGMWPFVVWMLAYPLLTNVEKMIYRRWVYPGEKVSDGVRAAACLVEFAIWGFVGWLLWHAGVQGTLR